MDLWAAYRSTRYRVRAGEGELVLRVGARHPELDALLAREAPRARSWAYLTAWNPGQERPSEAENERAQAVLKARVARRWPTWEGSGTSEAGDWSEPSLLVAEISREEAVGVAEDFRQWALVFGEIGGPAELVKTRWAGHA